MCVNQSAKAPRCPARYLTPWVHNPLGTPPRREPAGYLILLPVPDSRWLCQGTDSHRQVVQFVQAGWVEGVDGARGGWGVWLCQVVIGYGLGVESVGVR